MRGGDGTGGLTVALPTVAGAVALVAAWELFGQAGRLDRMIYPPPSSIVATGLTILRTGELWTHLFTTLEAMVAAFAVAVAVGSVAGLALGTSPRLYHVMHPPIVALYALPKVTVFPIFMLFLGLGLTQRTFYGAFFGVFPMTVNVVAGVRDVDRTLVLLARALGMSRLAFWRKILVPSMLPLFVTGMRLAFVYSGIGVLVSEMFVSNRGIGQRLVDTAGSVRMPEYFVYAVVVFVVFGVVVNLMRWWEGALRRWRTD